MTSDRPSHAKTLGAEIVDRELGRAFEINDLYGATKVVALALRDVLAQ